MTRVVKRAVYGSLPNSHRAPRKISNNGSSISHENSYEREDSYEESNSSFSSIECSSSSLKKEFLRYSDGDSDEEESTTSSNLRSTSVSNNFVDFISQRTQLGCSNNLSSVDPEYGTRHLLINGNFKERVITMGEMNKIFCSQWLNDHQIVFGTKCNRVCNNNKI